MARKHNVVIVGNGLFGSIAATLARSHGHNVTVVSNKEPHAGSLASGCVLAPSWLSSLDRSQIDTAMGVLNGLYDVIPVTFQTNLLKSFRASRVDPKQVLVAPDVADEVTAVGAGQVTLASGKVLRGKVLVAAGVWTSQLVQMPAMRGLWGCSLRVKGWTLDQPRIHVYAPYRQAVAFNISKSEVWMGDGTALIESTWQKSEVDRVNRTMVRANQLFGMPVGPSMRPQVGVRPYVEGHKAGYFENPAANTWVSTGGAKNGTALAAWQAHRFVTEALR